MIVLIKSNLGIMTCSSTPSKTPPKKASKPVKNPGDGNLDSKPAAKVAAKASKTQEDAPEVVAVTPGNSPARIPAKISKFARKTTGIVVSAKMQNGHYGSVVQIKGGMLLTWFSVVSKDKIQEPFTKPFKDYVDTGLAHKRDGISSPESKFVEDTKIIMICSCCNADGSEMKQKKGSGSAWKQCLHMLPEDVKDKAK